jgi:cell division protein FtsL
VRPSELLFLGAAVLCLMAPALLALWERAELLSTGYRIEQLRRERAQLRELVRKLRVERASLASLPAVERTAREELHLVTPPNDRVFYVTDGEVR